MVGGQCFLVNISITQMTFHQGFVWTHFSVQFLGVCVFGSSHFVIDINSVHNGALSHNGCHLAQVSIFQGGKCCFVELLTARCHWEHSGLQNNYLYSGKSP